MDGKSAIGCSTILGLPGALIAGFIAWHQNSNQLGALALCLPAGAIAGFVIAFTVILVLEMLGTE